MAILTDSVLDGSVPVGPRIDRASDDDGFIEAVGERIALFGAEDGVMEVWMWPLLALHDLTFAVRDRGSNRTLDLGARSISATPVGVTLGWSTTQIQLEVSIVAARDERTLVMLCELRPLDGPVELELRFLPAMRPMWPAGMGGQIVDLDAETGAVLLSEEIGRYAVLIGSPDAVRDGSSATRGVRQERAVRIPVERDRTGEDAVIIAIAGAERAARPLSPEELRGGNQSATGFARATEVTGAARAALRGAWSGWREIVADERRRWSAFLDRTPTLETDDPELDAAFLWSKIAIERAWVNVDGVGRGIIAGYGPGRGSERPGYGWYFNGDAFEACLAYAALGEYDACRSILRFAASAQRDDGKLTHEITLSAGLCDWYGDYPYAYYKGNQTPEFLVTLCDYHRWSRDADLVRELWPAALAAHDWCRTTCDEQGVMRVPLAGIAAVEAGPVSDRIDAEVFLQGSWLEAQRAMLELGDVVGDEVEVFPSALDPMLAREPFEDPTSGALAFARLKGGGHLDVRTTYAALPLARGVIAATDAEVLALNRPELTADWGGRMFSAASDLYDAEHYNLGSVFPFLTQHIARALYARGFDDAAWQVLRSQAQLVGFGGPGVSPEFLAGDRARLLPHSVPHQTFSHAPLIRMITDGLLGLDPADRSASPRRPLELRRMTLRRLPWGAARPDVQAAEDERTEPRPRAAFPWRIHPDEPSCNARLIATGVTEDGWFWDLAGPAGSSVSFPASLPPGSEVEGGTYADGHLVVDFSGPAEDDPSGAVGFTSVRVRFRRADT